MPLPETHTDFLQGIVTLGGAGDPALKVSSVRLLVANISYIEWFRNTFLLMQYKHGQDCFLLF
jgi:hypothetical protein